MKFILLAVLVWLAGCDDMTDQPKMKPYAGGARMPGTPPAGTASTTPIEMPPPVTAALLDRGRGQYHAFCAPCHAERGDGNGMVVQRGFPAPPSLHDATMRDMSPAQLFDAVSGGRGQMYGFAARIAPADRWAVIAYVKALQFSRNVKVGDLTPDERQRLP